MSDMLNISCTDGTFNAYLAKPEKGIGPGVIVIQEIFGVNDNIRAIADNLAAQGFYALAPDLFWRIEPNVQLSDQSEADWQKAFSLMSAFDADAGVRDIQESITTLRNYEGCTGKVGLIGFCLGGKMAYLAATDTDVECAIGYYGVGIQDMLEKAETIKNPLMLHIAGKDEFVPMDAQAKIQKALGKHEHITLHTYPDDDHAFAREGGAHYSASSAATANARTLNLLKDILL